MFRQATKTNKSLSFRNWGAICAVALIVVSSVFCLAPTSVLARHKVQQQNDPGGGDKWHAAMVPDGIGLPDLNVRVVNFAVQNLGQKIGNGECWTLAQQALIKSGGQRPRGFVFGRELVQNEPWLAGDIIQFTDCHFVDVQPNRRTTITLGEPDHTAIIHSIPNGLVVVLEQNVNHDKRVQTQTLNFATMTSGNIKVYRPLPAN